MPDDEMMKVALSEGTASPELVKALDLRIAALEKNIGMRGKPSLNSSKDWAPPALISGGVADTKVSVPGAKVGDYALAGLTPPALPNYQVTATVTADDEVTIGVVQHAKSVLYQHPAGKVNVRVYPA